MPTPEHTSLAAIVAAARGIVEAGGLTELTMQAVAEQVGVRAPSLYKRVRDRDELVRLVVESTLSDLTARLQSAAAAVPGDAPCEALVAVVHAARDFAQHNPHCYALSVGPLPPSAQVALETSRAAAAPLLQVVERLVAPGEALNAARTITAWTNGFVLMQLAGAFQLGGDIDDAYQWGLTRIVDAIAGTKRSVATDSD